MSRSGVATLVALVAAFVQGASAQINGVLRDASGAVFPGTAINAAVRLTG